MNSSLWASFVFYCPMIMDAAGAGCCSDNAIHGMRAGGGGGAPSGAASCSSAAARAPSSGACPRACAHCAPPSGAGAGGGAAGGFRPIGAGSAVTCSALGSRPAWCVKRIRRRRRRSITGRPVTNTTGRLRPGGWIRWGEGVYSPPQCCAAVRTRNNV